MQLVSKYVAYTDDVNTVCIRSALVAPTGREADVDQLVTLATGDGQWDLGNKVIYETWGAAGGYHIQLPDKTVMRIPVSEGDPLTSDKELVKRNLGDIVSLGTSLSYEVSQAGLSFSTGYNFQHGAQTSYEGTAFDPLILQGIVTWKVARLPRLCIAERWVRSSLPWIGSRLRSSSTRSKRTSLTASRSRAAT
jgi:hypothetical protein